jgi:spore coat protein A, manganese oxidase
MVYGPQVGAASPHPRKVALFEGTDEFGRLQPLLGVVEPGNETNFYGSRATPYTWFQKTTENPEFDSIEEWEIYNFTGDAHPIHLHLVNFEILGRKLINFNSDEGDPGQPILQHNGTQGRAPIITNLSIGADVPLGPSEGYVENAPKDMVTA